MAPPTHKTTIFSFENSNEIRMDIIVCGTLYSMIININQNNIFIEENKDIISDRENSYMNDYPNKYDNIIKKIEEYKFLCSFEDKNINKEGLIYLKKMQILLKFMNMINTSYN